ncbi:MAG: hypothetical protein GXP39_10555 [Chloroflexi bacterium]|nr:hypothetical protein [Chloroflexota bacterium]
MSTREKTILPGLFLIVLGIWLLFRELGLTGFRSFWPLFVILAGFGAWHRYLAAGASRRPDDAFWGTALLLIGFLFLLRENAWLGPATLDWALLWPIFPAIVGISASVQWLLHPRRWSALLWSLMGWAVALVGFAYTFEIIPGWTVVLLSRLWPLLLVLAGIALVVQSILESYRRTL